MKILFFDDDEMLRNMYAIKFKQAGFEYVGYEYPTVTGDPIELVLKEKPDLISTDIIHPGKLSGFDFIKVLKADIRTKDIPIVVLTNMSQIEHIKTAIDLGAVDYFVTAMIIPSEYCAAVKSFLTDRENYKNNIDKLIKD
jgi:DNA-binding response OmpR family regulator